ncbi:MAG: biopolymer transporter ExbD [Phycisphaeraceae bacterium]|nr:biopolymer transporter ExbD [Phycisphaeraceae bacterium]
MQIKTGFEDRKARVEFLPLIDVVFLLLVFFIYAMLAMVVHRGIEVSLPTGGTTQISQQDYVNITLDASNQISVNGQPATLQTLIPQVQDALKKLQTNQVNQVDAPIFIAGDQEADLGKALKILDKLRNAQYTKVSFELQEQQP